MHSAIKTFAFAGALLLASCDEETSAKPTDSDSDTTSAAKLFCLPGPGFQQIQFGTGGGFSGGGTGEFLRLTSDGQLMRVVAKPLQTDSGPQWSGKYDTAIKWVSYMDRFSADSVLHSQAVLSPKPVPDSAYATCNDVYDGFYWMATATFTSDSVSRWNAPSKMCFDKSGPRPTTLDTYWAGTPLPTPVSEAVAALQKLEARLEATYFPSAPVED